MIIHQLCNIRFCNLRSVSYSLVIAYLLSWPMPTQAGTLKKLFENPIAMTLTQALAFPATNDAEVGSVNVLPMRPRTPLLEDRHDLRFRYYLQKNPAAPLVFVLPGTGGVSASPGALFIAEKLHAQGYHTVTVDNAFSWPFVVAGSTSTLPGYGPDDARDLYNALEKVRDHLVSKARITPRSYSLIGYSLGGLQSVFLKRLDASRGSFSFSKVVLLNTPLDLLYGLAGIDRIYERGSRVGDVEKQKIYGRVISAGEKYLGQGMRIDFSDATFLERAFADLRFNDDDMTYLIGQSFRDSMRDVIFASQQVQDRHILKTTATTFRRGQRYQEAASFSFMSYVEQFLVPSVRERHGAGLTLAEINRRSSLYQFADDIRRDPQIYAVHSEDDFILKPGDLRWLKKQFGPRLTLFRYGGHCGSINFPQFSAHLKVLFPADS